MRLLHYMWWGDVAGFINVSNVVGFRGVRGWVPGQANQPLALPQMTILGPTRRYAPTSPLTFPVSVLSEKDRFVGVVTVKLLAFNFVGSSRGSTTRTVRVSSSTQSFASRQVRYLPLHSLQGGVYFPGTGPEYVRILATLYRPLTHLPSHRSCASRALSAARGSLGCGRLLWGARAPAGK